jgi:hypothetical protein
MDNDFGITQADRERMGKRIAANDSQRRANEAKGQEADSPVDAANVRTVCTALDDALDESDDSDDVAWVRSNDLCAGPERFVSNEIVRQVLEDIEDRSIRRYECLNPGEAEGLTNGLTVTLWSDPNQTAATYRVALDGEREHGQGGE